MGITGTWAQRQEVQSGAAKWGTGFNPIHKVRSGSGRNVAPQGNTGWVDPSLTHESDEFDEADYQDALAPTVYGYGPDTGTSDRPRWNEMEGGQDFDVEGFPSWGHYQAGLPGGTAIRAQDHGSEASYVSRNPVADSAMAGWYHKQHTDVNLPVTSDPKQYEVNTSMRQREGVRTGSQMSSGRASEYSAPIASRQAPMKERAMVGDPQRREAMTPKAQYQRVRPWWPRQAGTGAPSRMAPNSMYASEPLTRQPPAIPDQGRTVGESLSGWTDEDGGWY